ncbi:hypothetical protein P170DRAFT_512118 [Aspergillus steynii IBT 23096]|uniref:EDC4-like protein pdc1 beta-propeller domain-containing protein n=1 Tax=Aspergillus steynii IBT 23096 TaxID=1392250 RepID=A0A2I2FXS2_9EURO|nr:uncharacterized protein P170DRAFT_512118 [Aspergillus steynii IBT 23096]PLB45420.1 hypothetical protein P170DRAFT_512118 [Aspergillus steynii IBT 23096]
MSTPNDLQALLASIRPRPSPSNTPGQDAPMPPYSQQYHPGYRQQQQQQQQQHQQPPYDGQSFPHPQLHQHGYRHPSVSSAIHSPSPLNTPPHHGSDILSPNVPTPRGDMFPQQQLHPQHHHPQPPLHQHQPLPQNPDRAANLLNLLKFNQSGAGPAVAAQQQVPVAGVDQHRPSHAHEVVPEESNNSAHARNISASDLVASLFGRQGGAAPPVRPAGSQYHPGSAGVGEGSSAAPTAENTQDMLLRLLNRPKPGQDVPEGPVKSMSQSPASISPQKSPYPEVESGSLPMPSVQAVEESLAMGSVPEDVVPGKPDAFAPPSRPSPASKDSIFTYVNPFDQLAAASPRKESPPQPKSGTSESSAIEVSATEEINVTTEVEPTPVYSKGKRAKSPPLADDQKNAVNQVVDKLVDQLCRDVGEPAVPSAEEQLNPAVSTSRDESAQEVLSSVASHLRETAAEAKEIAQDGEFKEAIKETAAAAKEFANQSSGEALADSWESAEDSAEKEEQRVVAVHNFPLKPFISIAVKVYPGKLSVLRDDGIMDIARLKKDFDQLDRSLTSATSDYIVYALAKNGGIRIIRQDDGSDKQVFRAARDRVFNVAVCTSQTTSGVSEEQAVLGIGVSGTVYWALISKADKDLFELDALESESLIFPPFPASDENTSGGQLKTRAKRSSRHPGLFAIGRGKNIYVISPQAAANPAYGVSGNQRTVNTEKFFKERALKISTGKAGKDFMFSDDDTVIASLDKTGRLRFWDIREVATNSAFFTSGPSPTEVRVPLNTFVTGSPAEKSWPTSVLFIDKLRPYVKSMALRYVLVGLKQNHTLQLWDIGLGKAVQELKFPHENESDAICSVAYHPGSGIIVVGHPTRNSIYFVHLSAPRYNLQPMSQASFIKRSAEKDSSLPKPESTACLSGIRELSFNSKGQLRSLDLLPITKAAGDDSSSLFELYVMHSRGVTCLNIKKEDLGWSPDNKIVRPVNALEEGLIEISELQTFPTYVTDEPSINGDTASTPSKTGPKEVVKKVSEPSAESASAAASASALRTQSPTKQPKKKVADEPPVAEPAATVAASEKQDKKKNKKKSAADVAPAKAKDVTPSAVSSEAPVPAAQPSTSGEQLNGSDAFKAAPAAPETTPLPVTPSVGVSDNLDRHLEALQNGVSAEFSKSLGREIEGLYRRFDDERRSWDAASAAKQDQVLRLVSSTLSENVEKNLARIVSDSIRAEVVPALSDLTSTAVGKQLSSVVAQQIGGVVPRELRQALPESVSRAVQQPEVVKVLSEAVSQKLTPYLDGEISKSVNNAVTPAFKNLTARVTEKVGADMERQMQAQFQQFETQRQNDAAKIDQLTTMVRGLSDTVASMAAAQTNFQNEILKLNHVAASQQEEQRRVSRQSPAAASSVGPGSSMNAQDAELADITRLISEGRYEEGSVKWLQSEHQADLFNNLFIQLSPSYLTNLSPIVALSVGVAVTSSLQTNVTERLAWLDVVLQTVNPMDPDIIEVAPRIMSVLLQRLETLYMSIAQNAPHDPILRKIPPLSRRARALQG